MYKPHFVRDYRRLVRTLVAATPSYDEAMAKAVGGHYDLMGRLQRQTLEAAGLKPDSFIIDVGAGSGRLAAALADLPALKYLGTDVVPELLNYAQDKAARSDWNFVVMDKIAIPAPDGVADMVAFFSVLTHLTESEGLAYLKEAMRVLKPGGGAVVSYLDRSTPEHQRVAGLSFKRWVRRRLFGAGVMNTLLDKDTLRGWAARLDLDVELPDTTPMGQKICLFRKRS